MARRALTEIIAGLLALLFAYAAISKLLDYETFKFQLGKSPYVNGLAGFIAWALPCIEIAVVLLLLFKKSRLAGLYASFFLMLFFTGYIYAILKFSYYIPCSCGGILSSMSWKEHLIFNIAFTLLALTAILLYRREAIFSPREVMA